MKWCELKKNDAQTMFDDYVASGKYDCPDGYRTLRDELTDLFAVTLSELQIGPEDIQTKNYSYQVDYLFGMKMYALLNDKYSFNIRNASTADVWRFLSIQVVPDIVRMRYGPDHPDRFWKHDKRIWLRVLWWYIYLSWQGSESDTIAVLKDNSTDEILQLVDRCGRGYRVGLYREIMKQYSLLPADERRKKQIFRRMMVLNTARVETIDPELVDGGEAQYVKDILSYFDIQKE